MLPNKIIIRFSNSSSNVAVVSNSLPLGACLNSIVESQRLPGRHFAWWKMALRDAWIGLSTEEQISTNKYQMLKRLPSLVLLFGKYFELNYKAISNYFSFAREQLERQALLFIIKGAMYSDCLYANNRKDENRQPNIILVSTVIEV